MSRSARALAPVLLATVAVAACGSSTPAVTHTSTAPAVHVSHHTVTVALPARRGSKPTLAAFRHLRAPKRRQQAHVFNLPPALPDKLQTLAQSLEAFWSEAFGSINRSFDPGSVVVVGAPQSCGTTEVTTSDRPDYCTTAARVDLPVGYFQGNIAPLGDAATALAAADVYSQRVLDQLGMLGNESPAQLERATVCLSGLYMSSLPPGPQGNGIGLGPGDEESVNRELAAEAASPSVSGAAGSVTTIDLTAAFNSGVLGNACL